MKIALETRCPGCGAPMFALSLSDKREGVARVSATDDRFATWRRTEKVDAVCVNGCEVEITRESGELTAKQLDAIGELPLLAEAFRVASAVNAGGGTG